jgi:hypothetical protein
VDASLCSRAQRLRKRLAAALWLTLASMVAGCPRETTIEVSAEGMMRVFDACAISCRSSERCCGATLPRPELSSGELHGRLMLVAGNADEPSTIEDVKAESACFPMAFTCRPGQPLCFAEAINLAIDGAIADGFGYDGLKDPSEVALYLALFEPRSGLEPCAPATLAACAGLDAFLGGSYDIVCASCAGSSSNAAVPPCVRECFVDVCHGLLQGP